MTIHGNPVVFQRPDNWDDMSAEEKSAFLDNVLDSMGFAEVSSDE